MGDCLFGSLTAAHTDASALKEWDGQMSCVGLSATVANETGGLEGMTAGWGEDGAYQPVADGVSLDRLGVGV